MVTKEQIVRIIKSPYFYGSVFALMVLVKSVLFNWFAFDQIIVSSLWKNPAAFWGFYWPKIAMAIGVAAFVLLCNRKWVAIVLSVIIDLWIIANLMYVRSYGMVIDAFSITMIGNLSGFESSLPLYMRWADVIYPILTIGVAFIPYTRVKRERRLVAPLVCLLFAVLLGYFGQYCYLRAMNGNKQNTVAVFCWRLFTSEARHEMHGVGLIYPTQHTSILHLIGYDIYDMIVYLNERCHPYQLSSVEKDQIDQFYNSDASGDRKMLDGSLVLVIVESFEDWVFQPWIMPNLTAFCESHPVFYADKVKAQVRGGMSADGQLLINTGLLPTLEGAACYRFPGNTYPGIVKLIDGKSASLVPHPVDVWNQNYMSLSYGYDTTVQVSPVDTILFHQVLDYLHGGYKNIQVLTMSTHSPFKSGAVLSDLVIDEDMPVLKHDYIKAFNTLDYGLNILLEAIDSDSILHNATILITGDHNVLSKDATCPLIIYTPSINTSVAYTEECYQMDIYPTLVDVLDMEPYWQGFGISLLSKGERCIDENQALELSDKMHRANYFAHVGDNIPHYIAHAGGMIEGYTYTNSIEAVNNALANSIHCIELDLMFTSDDSLVASHDWMGCEDIVLENQAPTYAEFMNHKIYGRFTPIDYARIDSIMQANPKLYLVVDKISDYDIISRYFGKYKERLVIESFKDEDYFRLKKAGYEVFCSEYPPTKKGVWKNLLRRSSLRDFKIETYVFSEIERSSFSNLHGDVFSIYTLPDLRAADALFGKDDRIKYIYVDNIDNYK